MKKDRKKVASKRAQALFRRFKELSNVPPINPDFFYRLNVCPAFIGLELSQINLKISTGELPKPCALSETGRALGYYGSQLLELKAKRIRKAQAA